MNGNVGVSMAPDGAPGGVRGRVGRRGGAARWPVGVSAGPVGRAVWAVLCATDGPITVRDIARLVGAGRESTGRVLTQLEIAGWAARERGDTKAAAPDYWSAATQARAAWLDGAAGFKPTEASDVELMFSSGEEPFPEPLPTLEPLPAGHLQQLVLELLQHSPDHEFGPVRLAHMLGGRSQGAVANACERLTAAGLAVRSCEAPRRYQASDQER
jgi:hypothetical protein